MSLTVLLPLYGPLNPWWRLSPLYKLCARIYHFTLANSPVFPTFLSYSEFEINQLDSIWPLLLPKSSSRFIYVKTIAPIIGVDRGGLRSVFALWHRHCSPNPSYVHYLLLTMHQVWGRNSSLGEWAEGTQGDIHEHAGTLTSHLPEEHSFPPTGAEI